MTAVTSLFLEQRIERFFDIILRSARTAAARIERYSIVRLEVIAKIRAAFILHVIRLRFRALITSAGIEKAAIFAAIGIGFAMRTFILAPQSTDELDFASTAMANHTREDSKFIRNESNL
ncbi:MAG: hypothetical protein U0Y68_11305 [Blastocatellia bacterium]